MNPSAPTSPALLPASPEQQAILHRIVAQRERLKARHAAMRQLEQRSKPNSEDRLAVPEPFAVRLLAFARLHPLFAATVVAAALAAGPARLNRLGHAVLPWLRRLR